MGWRLLRLWWRLTYWQVPCEGCNGTGICTGRGATKPHSCCGDCARIRVASNVVPAGFQEPWEIAQHMAPLIGNGVMWRRPWSRRQVLRPRLPATCQ